MFFTFQFDRNKKLLELPKLLQLKNNLWSLFQNIQNLWTDLKVHKITGITTITKTFELLIWKKNNVHRIPRVTIIIMYASLFNLTEIKSYWNYYSYYNYKITCDPYYIIYRIDEHILKFMKFMELLQLQKIWTLHLQKKSSL